ncbi:MAG: hypothetical protein RIQ71_815 [Verrucomicrobiota bacterium]|jgi:hypothetical protein
MKRLLLIATLGLGACATLNQSQVDPQILNEFSKRGVPQETVFKVRDGMPLSVADVATSAKAGVPGPGLVSYMQSTRKAYNLSNADLSTLRSAGTPAPVINYMQRSYELYTKGPKAVDQSHPYFTDGRNNIEAPFAYAPPQIDTFFNSGYEESLYSPFSND